MSATRRGCLRSGAITGSSAAAAMRLLAASMLLLVSLVSTPVHAIVFEVPLIDHFDSYFLYNFTKSPLRPPLTLTQSSYDGTISHAAATFGPPPGEEGQHGSLVILDRDLIEGLENEFLCKPLPSMLRLNESILPRLPDFSGYAGEDFAASGFLEPRAWERWPLLDTTLSPAGTVLVASRGECSFERKAFFAQQAGAAALIVSSAWNVDNNRYDDRLVTMDPESDRVLWDAFLVEQNVRNPGNYSHQIPAVYVSRISFNWHILPLVLGNLATQMSYDHAMKRFLNPQGANITESSSSGAAAWESSSSGSAGSGTGSRRRLLADESSSSSGGSFDPYASSSSSSSTGSDSPAAIPYVPTPWTFIPVRGIIDAYNTVDPSTIDRYPDDEINYGGLRLAAYLLLILPAVWLSGACVYLTRLVCRRRRAKALKDARNNLLRVVTYRAGVPDATAAVAAAARREGLPPLSQQQQQVKTPPRDEGKDAIEDADGSLGVEMTSTGYAQLHSVPLIGGGGSSSSAAGAVGTGAGPLHLSSAAALALDMPDDDDAVRSPSASLPAASGAANAAPAVASASVGIDSRGKHVRIVGTACAICLTDYEDGETLKVLPCAHGFHRGCIDPWMERSDECAVCRASVSEALHVEPACWAWCCDPPPSNGMQRQARARADERARARAAQQQQQQQHQAVVIAEPIQREGVPNILPLSAAALDRDLEGQPQAGRPSRVSSIPVGIPIVSYHPDPAERAQSDLHAEAILASVRELLLAVERSGIPHAPNQLPALQVLRVNAAAYAQQAHANSLNDADALSQLRLMSAQLPQFHAYFSGARSNDDVTEAIVAVDSVLQFAQEKVQRKQRAQ